MIHSEIHGEEGIPLVFLHGFTLDQSMWEKQYAHFAFDHRCIGVDIPGFGKSSIQSSHNIQEVAIGIRRHIKTLIQEEPYLLCGLSLGGYVALEMARCFQDDLMGLILSNTEGRADNEAEKKKRDQFCGSIASEGGEGFINSVAPILSSSVTQTEDMGFTQRLLDKMRYTSDESLIFGLKMMRERPNYLDFAPSFHKPTLIIGGEDDQLCSKDDVKNTHQAFGDAKLEFIFGTGHLTPMENPIEWNRVVSTFLQDQIYENV